MTIFHTVGEFDESILSQIVENNFAVHEAAAHI